ncbi:unnamed protein product [Caenorhabditis angaria]|uniref:Serpentine receptor class gamma n=1 Tax=Caenorhabditis angaria TaxID=860376 RepID=A0A9P1I9N8_9PELO|nr:unnamed protein product [Caenorhabditis angaria]
MVLMSSKNVEQKVFAQLFVTVVLYTLMFIFYEAVVFLNGILEDWIVVNLISVVNIINYLPEISLPLMLMISALKFMKKFPKSTSVSTSSP